MTKLRHFIQRVIQFSDLDIHRELAESDTRVGHRHLNILKSESENTKSFIFQG